jgi:hypothetical protein
MNSILNPNGGRPIYNDDLDFIAAMIQNTCVLDLHQGYPLILWGCTNLGGGVISAGIILDPSGAGELFYHPQTTYPGFDPTTFIVDYLDVQTDTRTYADSSTHACFETRYAYFTTSPVNWNDSPDRSRNYATLNTLRLDMRFYHILNNNLNFNNGDIYTTSGPEGSTYHDLALQSFWGVSGNTMMNLFNGNVNIGATKGSTPNNTAGYTNINTQMKFLGGTITNIYSGVFTASSGPWTYSAGSGTLDPVNYDRILYIYQELSASSFVITWYGSTGYVGCNGNYNTVTINVPAGVTLVFTGVTGVSGNLNIGEQHYGNV